MSGSGSIHGRNKETEVHFCGYPDAGRGERPGLTVPLQNIKKRICLIRYLQSVFIKQVGNPAYNPYAEYSCEIDEEIRQLIMSGDKQSLLESLYAEFNL